MKKRICPICDQEMKKAHYCQNCKQYIKKPIVRDMDYHLNDKESRINYCDCDYHVPKKNSRAAYHPAGGQSDSSVPGKSTTTMVRVFLFVFILLMFVPMIIGLGSSAMVGMINALTETEPAAMAPTESRVEYFTDDEVTKQGESCNGYAHFAVDKDTFQEQILEWAKDNIAAITYESEDSENVSYPDEKITYYDTYTACYFSGDEGAERNNWIQIGEDTVTGLVHYVDISMVDEAKWLSTVEKAMEILADNEVGITDKGGLDEFRLAYVSGELEGNGSYWESELFDIYFYRYSDGAPSITIYKMNR